MMISTIKNVSKFFSAYFIIERQLYTARLLILPTITRNYVHVSEQYCTQKKISRDNALMTHYFANVQEKKKENFLEILREYVKKNPSDQDCLEFMKIALSYMDEYGLQRDIEVYKCIMNVLPKGKYVATNLYQAMFVYYPKHQYTVLEVLCKMETNRLIPDDEMEQIALNTFGSHSLVAKKIWRMWYWLPKFKYLNPWPVPEGALKDVKLLAKHSLHKLGSVDVRSEITEFNSEEIKESIDKTWIVSVMSPDQEELLLRHPVTNTLYVEGPVSIWSGNQSLNYFVLRADRHMEYPYIETDDVSNLDIPFWRLTKKGIMPNQTIHEQADGTYFASCCTGTSSKDSLLSWIRFLEKKHPILKEIPIVFRLRSSTREDLYLKDDERKTEKIPGTKQIEIDEH